ncbi:Hypothetical protein EPM1_3299 [Stenotrophomonas maltophilia EPM1]|nr:Hypothetical protein EPM1_3299 [Stenotrophomonas maltophilia EPM1]
MWLRRTEDGTGHGGPGRARALGRHPEARRYGWETDGQAVLAPPETKEMVIRTIPIYKS